MIQVSDLTYMYPKQKEPSVKNMSFTIEKGEIFGFLGPSGAGKSTTQKILIGLLKGYTGSVKVQGNEVSQLSSSYYESIGVAFEFPNFYSKFTALENLQHFKRFYSVQTKDPLELLKAVGLEQAADTKVGAFSKGMKMRLNFCRSLMNNPKLLFLDEPTSGLDPVNAKMLTDQIIDLKNAGTTIILTTHNMHLAEKICDRVAFIVDGNIRLIDSPSNLKMKETEKAVEVQYKAVDGSIQKGKYPLSGLKENQQFLNLLNEDKILSIHTEESTLEDLFIEVTGRSLR